MATRGKPIDAATIRSIQRLAAAASSVRATARGVQVSPTTVQKYKRREK